MAHNERLFIDYEGDPGAAPSTLVGKFPSPNPDSRAAGGSGAYQAEVLFYLQVAPHLSLRVPDCFYGALSEDGTIFTLLLEDMAPAQQGDQIAGASDAQLEAAVVNLAGLHAPLWNDPKLDTVSLAPLGLNADFTPLMQGATPAFLERYADRLSEETKGVFRGFAEGFAAWAESGPPDRTLVHGDYRLDNLLFLDSDGPDSVTTVDWQTISVGNGGRDLAYMLGNGCDPEQRRAAEPRLLEIYRATMAKLGVELTSEQVHAAYRHGSFQGPYVTILGSLAVGQTDRGDAMFMAMAERSAAQILDLGALELLGS